MASCTLEVRVDGPLRVELPHLGFDQSFRIRTRVVSEVDSSGLSSERQQLLLVNECFGELLRANSVEGEEDPNFTEIAELWRFSL